VKAPLKERGRASSFAIADPALDTMFAPESIALIGATEAQGSVGRALENVTSYHGLVYPVNLKRETILGVSAFPKIGAVPDHIDLAIIATSSDGSGGTARVCRGRG
jgi:acetyltransferase